MLNLKLLSKLFAEDNFSFTTIIKKGCSHEQPFFLFYPDFLTNVDFIRLLHIIHLQ